MNQRAEDGFTLVEVATVVVIIGLIVGGIMVGHDLINAAGIRAQISQIEKYNAAANTFRTKYGYLPGDIPDPAAISSGFKARGPYQGEGDGNGLIEGNWGNVAGNGPSIQIMGETATFWVDLSTANLIDNSFSLGAPSTCNSPCVITGMGASMMSSFFPAGKIGNGNFIAVWSSTPGGGGVSWWCPGWCSNSSNFFTLMNITGSASGGTLNTKEGLSVAQAYNIDQKIDDGMPTTGRVMAIFFSLNNSVFSGGGDGTTSAAAASSTTCFDNGGASGRKHYSTEVNGSGINCALSFQFQ